LTGQQTWLLSAKGPPRRLAPRYRGCDNVIALLPPCPQVAPFFGRCGQRRPPPP
jgi:hypothetical protein